MVFLPKRQSDKPAMIAELKWNHLTKTAIGQIKDRKFTRPWNIIEVRCCLRESIAAKNEKIQIQYREDDRRAWMSP